MTREKLDAITKDIRENVVTEDVLFTSSTIIINPLGASEIIDELVNIIFSLHNELYKEVTGQYYDYMFHWCNKVDGSCTDRDNRYKNLVTDEIEEE